MSSSKPHARRKPTPRSPQSGNPSRVLRKGFVPGTNAAGTGTRASVPASARPPFSQMPQSKTSAQLPFAGARASSSRSRATQDGPSVQRHRTSLWGLCLQAILLVLGFLPRLLLQLFQKLRGLHMSSRARVDAGAPGKASARNESAHSSETRARGTSFLRSISHIQFSFAFVLRACMLVLVCALIASSAFFVVSKLPVCTIQNLSVLSSEHVSADDIRSLAAIEDGTTLFSLDEDKITARLKKIPWVESVNYKREFPSTLELSINEKKVDMIAQINGSNVCWYVSQDGVWIEPVSFPHDDGAPSIKEQVIARAKELGAIALCDLPESVNPQAGSLATDDSIAMVQSFRKAFSQEFSQRIASYSAPSSESISCTTASGVDISLGTSSQIKLKEQVVTEILNKYEGKITYINARTPSRPSYRMINNASTQKGAGV